MRFRGFFAWRNKLGMDGILFACWLDDGMFIIGRDLIEESLMFL